MASSSQQRLCSLMSVACRANVTGNVAGRWSATCSRNSGREYTWTPQRLSMPPTHESHGKHCRSVMYFSPHACAYMASSTARACLPCRSISGIAYCCVDFLSIPINTSYLALELWHTTDLQHKRDEGQSSCMSNSSRPTSNDKAICVVNRCIHTTYSLNKNLETSYRITTHFKYASSIVLFVFSRFVQAVLPGH